MSFRGDLIFSVSRVASPEGQAWRAPVTTLHLAISLVSPQAMRRSVAETRRKIVSAAYDLFYKKGYVRVTVDLIAQHGGLTKRALYYHFRSKDELLAAALELHHELAMERIARWSATLGGTADDLVTKLFADLAEWSATAHWQGAGFTRLVMELADLPGHPARAIARHHKAAIERWFHDEIVKRGVVEADDKARKVMLLLEGCMSLLLINGDKVYVRAATEAAQQVVAHGSLERAHA